MPYLPGAKKATIFIMIVFAILAGLLFGASELFNCESSPATFMVVLSLAGLFNTMIDTYLTA